MARRSQFTLVQVSSMSAVAFVPPAASMIACGAPYLPLVNTLSLAESKRNTTGFFSGCAAPWTAFRRVSMSSTAVLATSLCPVMVPRLVMSVRTASHGSTTPRLVVPSWRHDSVSR